MKVLLVQPSCESSIWTFSEALLGSGFVGHAPNIALPTLAALAPEGVEVSIADEVVQPLDYEQKWDLVGITGYNTNRNRMIQIADEFRRRGQLVAIGGPYVSMSEATFRPHADILFIGEAENTWPEFLADFQKGSWKNEYRMIDPVDIQCSPTPDVTKLSTDSYLMGVVQTSRGCPFECEFCDVIVYLGRKQRHKKPDQVVQELENLYQHGYRHIFLADDNLTANRKRCAEIMTAVAEWNSKKLERATFLTQMSIDVARDMDQPLLALLAEAGVFEALVGIESSDPDALKDVKKRQNLRKNLVQDIQHIQRQGINVIAGMICGFDTDTRDSFRRHYDFVQEAGIPIVQLTLMNAPEGTPLEKRIIRENRLKPWPMNDVVFGTNIIPKNISYEELLTGFRWLLNHLYTPESFLKRVSLLAENSPPPKKIGASRQAVKVLQVVIPQYRKLGPEFRDIPEQIFGMYRNKNQNSVGTLLFFYLNEVLMLKKRGIWDPEIAQMENPFLESAMEEQHAN